MREGIVRIGGGTAAFTDSGLGVSQFVRMERPLDYIVFDSLAESVMGGLGRQMLADPSGGYVSVFIDRHVGPYLREILSAGTRLVTNSGGLNPQGCAEALRRRAAELGLNPRIAVVEGDNLLDRVGEFVGPGAREMFSGDAMADAVAGADQLLSFTAYLGALPVKAALDAGADIVVCGRIVDSATTLGALMHEFGWGAEDFDLLAAGTLAGHLIECSTQVTGGTFTDWQDVPDWTNIGFPIAECHADGTVCITKPAGTGGLVSVGTVSEQLLYEVEDVAAYVVPDVVCDFSEVRIEQQAPDRVHVSGARGRSRTATYKACLTFDQGWRATYAAPVIGLAAPAKAERLGAAIVARTRQRLRGCNLGDFSAVRVEAVGAEAAYGTHAVPEARQIRESIARIVAHHDQREAVELLLEEAATSLMLVVGGTMPLTRAVTPLQHLRSVLVDKGRVPVSLTIDGVRRPVDIPSSGGFNAAATSPVTPPLPPESAALDASLPLGALAWVRSGDKGDLFNVGVIAREARFLPFIAASLTPAAVSDWYGATFGQEGLAVERQYAPGLDALNLVVRQVMEGGIGSTSRFDTPGKGNGQILLEFPIAVPADIAEALRARSAALFGEGEPREIA